MSGEADPRAWDNMTTHCARRFRGGSRRDRGLPGGEGAETGPGHVQHGCTGTSDSLAVSSVAL